MAKRNRRMRSVMEHDFSVGEAPRIRRSIFNRTCGHKTTFNASLLYPLYTDEILPGDTVSMSIDGFIRMTTPVFPTMDNLYMDFHCWFVAMRHVWNNARRFFGEQDNPTDSTDYVIPQVTGDVPEGSLAHYMGIPIHTGGNQVSVNALYFRGYNLIWNEYYRDQDIQQSEPVSVGDGPDAMSTYKLLRRGKRHDYFTSCRPWPLKGGVEVDIPLGSSAPVLGIGWEATATSGANATAIRETGGGTSVFPFRLTGSADLRVESTASGVDGYPNVRADLTNAAAATINQFRQAVQVQRMLERDARFGTRYPEYVKSHFDANFEDLSYRPIYLGGGTRLINITPIAQTSSTDTTSPQGNLSAIGTANVSNIGFTRSFNEHGFIYVLASVRADQTYQRGIDRRFSRATKFDYFHPTLAHLGEQAVLRKEIHATGVAADDDKVFGYQERFADYRYCKSIVSGKFDSRATDTLDAWHYAQNFALAPGLTDAFIREEAPVARTIAVQNQPHFIGDFRFNGRWARPVPAFGTPGMVDHF